MNVSNAIFILFQSGSTGKNKRQKCSNFTESYKKKYKNILVY